MKVVYFISVLGQGIGGHTYSVKTTIEAMKTEQECILITIGRNESPVLKSLDVKKYAIVYKHFNPLKILMEIRRILEYEKPDVLHSFDLFSLFFVKCISQSLHIPYIVTKCGGPDPKLFFPNVDSLILFTIENKKYFERNKKFCKTDLFLIPNRINDIRQDPARIEKIKRLLPDDARIILRIARFNSVYKNGILQAFHLVERLNNEGIKTILLLVGAIQDQNVFEEIAGLGKSNVYILTQPEFTLHASQLIDISDCVVGTGRGFMEAATRKKILLCPLVNSEYPLLVTRENFLEVFEKNFSERTTVKKFDPDINYSLIRKAITEQNYRTDLGGMMREKSEEYFQINTQLGTYKRIYSNLKFKTDKNLIDFFIFLIIIIYFDYRYGKSRDVK